MTIWRPAQHIQCKTIGIVWRGDAILAADIYDDTGAVKGVRPLGGSIKFGECWEDALACEFQEEHAAKHAKAKAMN